ncbi:alpha/beta hydrolase [Catenovulum agarivorans DS-2]|uniref:Alpha/beta hydrolase n=1 Tax=Catenovulum agarivorans DS-2 TaxID=1328313 RepID=W7Q9Z3_9ALTE|nr:alpha/beta hydrolase [Catenovulum agarivorans]EWH09609.1 alpha/beta hydrolase [Catenovulum agarivorans DS-2]
MCYLTNFSWDEYQQNVPTLLCIHGWLDNSESFVPLAKYLDDYQLIIVELMGHGHSDHRSLDAHYHLIDWVYDLKLFCQQVQISELYLIGHSLGGAISAVLAASEPQLVKALILLESPGAFTQPEHELATNVHLAFESRIKMADKRVKSATKRPKNLLPALVQMRVEKNHLAAEYAEALIKRNLYIEANSFSWRSDARLQTLSPIRLTPGQAQEILAAIQSPVTICLAGNGYQVIKNTIEKHLDYFTKCQVKYFDGAHHFHMPQAQPLAQYIQRQVIEILETRQI